MISDIKNLNHEKFFNMYVMEGDEDYDEKMAQERIKGQGNLADSMKTPKINQKELKKGVSRERLSKK